MTTTAERAGRSGPSRVEAPQGYRTGEAGYRRITVALFAAGMATFALLYSTQALLPEFAQANPNCLTNLQSRENFRM